jgi:hypothetical protein
MMRRFGRGAGAAAGAAVQALGLSDHRWMLEELMSFGVPHRHTHTTRTTTEMVGGGGPVQLDHGLMGYYR